MGTLPENAPDRIPAGQMPVPGLSGTARAAFPVGPFRAIFAEPNLTEDERRIVDQFSKLYYEKLDSGRGLYTIVLSWLGHELFKCPLDLWIYQEMIVRSQPDLIIEVGTYKGGSALYMAQVCELVGRGEVVTIDIDASHSGTRPVHERIRYIHGSSTDPAIFSQVRDIIGGRTNVLVILDGDHRRDHVIEELRLYRSIVPVGGYIIVEDTNINGHPAYNDFGPGPWEAVDAFLAEDARFEADRTCERFLLTMNPRGFLRRTS